MADSTAVLVLIAVAFGLIGGLVVSRLGVRKGYSQGPFFAVGFVVVFGLSFLPIIVFVIGLVAFVGVMAKLPESGPKYGGKRKPAQRRR